MNDDRLRSIRINGTMRSVDGMEAIAEQFSIVAAECDSSAHEVAAIALRFGAHRIRELEGKLNRIERELHS